MQRRAAFCFPRALLSGDASRPRTRRALGGLGLPVHTGQVAAPQKHDAARAVGDVVVVGACGSRRDRGQFSARRRVDDDVMSLLDPNRTTGNGSNDDRKVELRHQLRLSPSRHCTGKAFTCRGRKRIASVQACSAPAIPVRDRNLRLAFRRRAFRVPITSSRTASASRPGGSAPISAAAIPGPAGSSWTRCREAWSRAGRQPILR